MVRLPPNQTPEPNPTRLADVRYDRGLFLRDVAGRAGLSLGYLHALEMGTKRSPSLAVARRLASALDTTVDDLFPEGEP